MNTDLLARDLHDELPARKTLKSAAPVSPP